MGLKNSSPGKTGDHKPQQICRTPENTCFLFSSTHLSSSFLFDLTQPSPLQLFFCHFWQELCRLGSFLCIPQSWALSHGCVVQTRESVGESFIACFASVVHTKLSVWVAHLTWGGRMNAPSDTSSSKALMVTKDSPSSSVSSFPSSSATTDMLNSLKAFTKFDPLSVTVAMMFSFDRPNYEWTSSNISAMRL